MKIDCQFKSILFIIGGITLIILAASELIVRLALALFGLFLIWRGLHLRGITYNTFHFHRFINRFNRPFF